MNNITTSTYEEVMCFAISTIGYAIENKLKPTPEEAIISNLENWNSDDFKDSGYTISLGDVLNFATETAIATEINSSLNDFHKALKLFDSTQVENRLIARQKTAPLAQSSGVSASGSLVTRQAFLTTAKQFASHYRTSFQKSNNGDVFVAPR